MVRNLKILRDLRAPLLGEKHYSLVWNLVWYILTLDMVQPDLLLQNTETRSKNRYRFQWSCLKTARVWKME